MFMDPSTAVVLLSRKEMDVCYLGQQSKQERSGMMVCFGCAHLNCTVLISLRLFNDRIMYDLLITRIDSFNTDLA